MVCTSHTVTVDSKYNIIIYSWKAYIITVRVLKSNLLVIISGISSEHQYHQGCYTVCKHMTIDFGSSNNN